MKGLLLREYLRMAVAVIKARPLRAALSVAGTFAGTLAVLAILGIHEGTRQQVESIYRLHDAQVFVIMPAANRSTGRSGRITPQALSLLAQEPLSSLVMPRVRAALSVRARGGPAQTLEVLGIDGAFASVYRIPVRGRSPLASEIDQRIPVCLVTDQGRQKLFPYGDPVGATILVKNRPCQVVGVADWSLAVTQRTFAGSVPDVLAPFTLMLRWAPVKEFGLAEVRVKGSWSEETVISRLRQALMRQDARRGHDYEIQSAEAFFRGTQKAMEGTLRVLLTVAAIGLLVGAMGTANVMLMSVFERTREIGLRKALGARREDILIQFLVEAVVLSGLGAALALVTASLAVALLPYVGTLPFDAVLSWNTGLSTIAVTLLVGALAGAYPASRAAQLPPATALRFE